MAEPICHIEGIGNVSLTRRKGSKRLSMRVKPDGSLSVNYPWFATQKEVVDFIMGNKEWVEKQRQKIETRKPRCDIGQSIKTKFHTITLVPVEKGALRAAINKNTVTVTVPPDVDLASERLEKFVQKVITEVCRNEAKTYLPMRVSQLASEHRFTYKQVFVKNLKSKWGSCSSKENINLSVHLMRLPDHLIDYIILHELAHTRHMNHGEGFWHLLDQITNGKAKQLRKEMRALKAY
jgi:predicted metal-dependent hydrolase